MVEQAMRFGLVTLMILMVGCSIDPVARIDGRGGKASTFGYARVQVIEIDGQAYADSQQFRNVTPGEHTVSFVTLRRDTRRAVEIKTITMRFEACQRYYFYAIHPTLNRPWEWRLEQGRNWKIGGCDASNDGVDIDAAP